MKCSRCGASLPSDAEFCGECGAKIKRQKKPSAAYTKVAAEAKRYKIISIILAVLCVAMGALWATSNRDPYESIDNYEEEVVQIDRAGVELSGMYFVGEDPELPEGRYNIYPPENQSYMSVYVYSSLEDAKKRCDADYNSLADDTIYSVTRGYRLKKGQIVDIEYDSAFFELVSEPTAESESVESEPASSSEQSETVAPSSQSETE